MKRMLTMLAMALAVCVALADTWTDSDTGITWTYMVTNGEACVGDGSHTAISTSTEGAVVVPDELGGCPVKHIGEDAFHMCMQITSVSLPDGLRTIGEDAFCYCLKLLDIEIPTSVTEIDNWAFAYCPNLYSITIPNGITNLPEHLFHESSVVYVSIPASVESICWLDCGSLKAVTVDADNQHYKSVDGVLYNKSMTELLIWPPCKEGSVEIPSCVEVLGGESFAFRETLTSIEIPAKVRSIDSEAFWGCHSLTGIYVNAGNSNFRSMDGVLYDRQMGCVLRCPQGKEGALEIPMGVTNIGESAFSGCSNLSAIHIPRSVSSIGDMAFLCCSGITLIEIPHGIVEVGDRTFAFCYGLHSAVLPASISNICGKAFFQCPLTNVFLLGDAPLVNGEAFFAFPVPEMRTATVYEGTTGWGNGDTWQGLKLIWRKRIFPLVDDDATANEIAAVLEGSADEKLAACITNAANYNAYREWAESVKGTNGTETAGAQAVKDSPNAWVSFALGSDKLLEQPPTDEELTVEAFEPSSEAGKFEFTVSVEGVEVGSDAQKENLKQVFGLEGATSLDPNVFSSGNVDLTFSTPEDGKVKFTAGPKATNAATFFMKVRVK